MSIFVPAAQYLRVSAAHRDWSIETQRNAIQKYAEDHGYAIIQTYLDHGKSGLRVKNRTGLTDLLRDALNDPTFKAILVYDVSRWGRFQNTDEAAYYEFMCLKAGIPVHYCAEAFNNDGSPQALVHKALKRIKAAEYSRRLSYLCFRGLKRLAEMGFAVGAMPGYAFRRLAVDKDRNPIRRLKTGDRKSLQTDRVLRILGPRKEIETVCEIYRLVLKRRKTPTEISEILNKRRVRGPYHAKWSRDEVKKILTNPKYTGFNFWNRTAAKLQTTQRSNPQKDWVVTKQLFMPIVTPLMFQRVQEILRELGPHWTKEEIIRKVKAAYTKHGTLNQKMFHPKFRLPDVEACRNLFGSMDRLYEIVGYNPGDQFKRSNGLKRNKALVETLVNQLPQDLGKSLAAVEHLFVNRFVFRLESGVAVCGRICPAQVTKRGLLWTLNFGSPPVACDLDLLCLLDEQNSGFYRFYLVPKISTPVSRIFLKENCPLLRARLPLNSLSELAAQSSVLLSSRPIAA